MKLLSNFRKNRGLMIKDRFLKSGGDVILDHMAKNMNGNKQCPYMMGSACIGQACTHFMEFKNIDRETKTEKTYWRCVHAQMPIFMTELNQNIRELIGKVNDLEIKNTQCTEKA